MNTLLWCLQAFGALVFGASGAMKVFMFDKISADVPSFGALPRGVWAALGVLELACTIGLIGPAVLHWKPWLTGVAATLLRLTDGQAYGLEAMLRRQKGRVTGWISYTLSRSERRFPCGTRPADYDQTHVLNLVAQAHLPRGFMIGARLYVATGRPETLVDRTSTSLVDTLQGGGIDGSDVLGVRNNIRMPTFVQLDLRLDKHWQFRRFHLAAFLEVVNATFSRSNLYLSYPTTETDQKGPTLVGFNWILPSIGLRGGF